VADKPQVVVCDDDQHRVEDWSERIKERTGADFDVRPLAPVDFAAGVAALKDRMANAKATRGENPRGAKAEVFDRADILILDSDLTPDAGSERGLDPQDLIRTNLVGEMGGEVAHLARAYSTAGAILVVNQKWKTRTFDLTMQVFASDVADVYISEKDLDNAGLWNGRQIADFRPWHWPVLSELPKLINTLAEEVQLNDSVLDTLGLNSPDVLDAITNRQMDGLAADDLARMTFRDVATASVYGLRPKEIVEEDQLKRVAACAVRRWLERTVLPSQNVLIDRPHLVQRRPWLVENRGDPAAWNRQDGWWASSEQPSDDRGYAPAASRWLGRHVWLWHSLPAQPRSANERVRPSDLVFCEDSSKFVSVAMAHDYMSDLEGPTAQRFVERLAGVEYSPRQRLLS
jgi:hypothetical protein